MAANIEFNFNRNTYSFYSLKNVPWHGLGTVVEEAKTPDEIIRIANMDYEVALAPMTEKGIARRRSSLRFPTSAHRSRWSEPYGMPGWNLSGKTGMPLWM